MSRTFIKLTNKHYSGGPVFVDASAVVAVGELRDTGGTRISLGCTYAEVTETSDEILHAIGLNDEVHIAVKPSDPCPTDESDHDCECDPYDAVNVEINHLDSDIAKRLNDLRASINELKEDNA